MVNFFDSIAAAAARQDEVEARLGTDWFERENFGDLFLSERDFPITEDVDGMTDADYDAMAEAMWVDPAEREW